VSREDYVAQIEALGYETKVLASDGRRLDAFKSEALLDNRRLINVVFWPRGQA